MAVTLCSIKISIEQHLHDEHDLFLFFLLNAHSPLLIHIDSVKAT